MWGVIFCFSFADVWATKDKDPNGERLKWNTREEAEMWAQANCGPNYFMAVELKEATNENKS